MSQKKKAEPESLKKSNPVLGVIALIAVVAAVAVFLFTRPGGDAPAPVTAQVANAPVAAQPMAQPKPVAQTSQSAAPAPETAPVQAAQSAKPPQTAEHPAVHSQESPVVVPSPVSAQKEPEYRIPAHYEDPDEAEPLAATLDPATVPDHARVAYEIARKKPRLLAQLPCFCYCDRMGHKSLHDCYVGIHAQECDVCLREALEADKMDSEGMSAKEIRDAIIATHHPRS